MATFVKKDGSPIGQVKLPPRLPPPSDHGVIGYLENFEIDHDYVGMTRRVRLSMRVNELEVRQAESVMSLLGMATGSKVEVRLVR